MKADLILGASKKVKQTGPASWIACCPAHEDRTPSMTVRELDDGRVLVHCFGGCSVEEILSASGLSFDALFPDKPIDSAKGIRRAFPAGDVLEALANESMFVATFVANLANGVKFTPEDYLRLLTAAARIQEGRRLALG